MLCVAHSRIRQNLLGDLNMIIEKIEKSTAVATTPTTVVKTPGLRVSTDPQSSDTTGTVSSPLTSPLNIPGIPIEIVMERVWTATKSESGRGKTGEFYWNAVISDGEEIILRDSKSTGFGGEDGILTKVEAHTWLPVQEVLLYRTPIDVQTQEAYPRSVSFSFRLIESDDSSEAEKIFKGLGNVAKVVVGALTKNPGAAVYTDYAVSFVNSLLSLDDDDLVISGTRGLLGTARHFRVGDFITMRTGNSVAGFSVIPLNDHGEDFFRYEVTVPAPGSKSESFSIPKAGSLSFLFRTYFPFFFPSQLRPSLKLVNSESGDIVFEKRFGKRSLSSYTRSVEKGEYHFECTSPMVGAKFSVMYAAYKQDLAVKDDLLVASSL